MNLDTTRISQEAQDVAVDLMHAMDLTKEEAFIYMIDTYAMNIRSGKRVEYKATPPEGVEASK